MRDEAPRESAGSWWTLGALSLASFLLLLGDTSLSVALPAVRRDLGLSLSGLEWLVNSYTLALAVLLLPAGKLADIVGARRVFLAGLALFTFFSVAAGLAPGAVPLLAARVLQGVGAALATPAALALITTTFPPRRRGVALGLWAGAATTALAVGPLAGAVLTESFGWRAVFLVNLPLGLAALVVAARLIPRGDEAMHPAGLDLAGFASSAVGLGALLYALTSANGWGWTSPRLIALLGLAVGGLAVFVVVERRSSSPLLDLHLFRSRSFAGANAVGLLLTSVMCSVFFFMSLYLQLILGYSALAAGALFLPMTLLVVLVAPLAGRLADRRGARLPMAGGMIVLAVSLVALAELGPAPRVGALVVALAGGGFGMGLTTTPMTTAALAEVPLDHAGAGAAALNMFRMVGLALGIVTMGAILAATDPAGLAGGFSRGLSTGLLVNAVIALAAAGLALTTIGGRTPSGEPAPEGGPRARGVERLTSDQQINFAGPSRRWAIFKVMNEPTTKRKELQ